MKPHWTIKINFQTLIYYSLASILPFIDCDSITKSTSITNHMCHPLETNDDGKCFEMAPANWFIVLDASWYNKDDNLQNLAVTKSTFAMQTLLADQIIKSMSEIERIQPQKHRMAILLATNQKISFLRSICDERPLENNPSRWTPYQNVKPSDHQILLHKVLNEIDISNFYCNESSWYTKQRIILYIAQHAPNDEQYFVEAKNILRKWHGEYQSERRSTQIYFIVLSESQNNGFTAENMNPVENPFVRGALYLNPSNIEAYDNLGKSIFKCACLMSEDCGTSEPDVSKPCHFEDSHDGEVCVKTIYRSVIFRGENVRFPMANLRSCSTYINVQCNNSQCSRDCDDKIWSSWSTCENSVQSRRRVVENAGHSQPTSSCPTEESRSCTMEETDVPSGPGEKETDVSSTLAPSRPPSSVLILGLVFVVLIFPGAIIALLFIAASNKQRARRKWAMLREGSLHGFDPSKGKGAKLKSKAPPAKLPKSFVPLHLVFDKMPPQRPSSGSTTTGTGSNRRETVSLPASESSRSKKGSGTMERTVHVNLSARERLGDDVGRHHHHHKKRDSSKRKSPIRRVRFENT